ncbi:hypothetical protein GGI25_006052 [Coemansia spiralis]|uniref:DUF3533 domain-containing protein n=2 Tax=Coemansia TaxID=4863 RepID=A0A9W8G3E4_9FUNG|nr:hypothetical protein EDC05_005433 [Coemansia umbellata]KAJ2619796.1 hypothetical protein GGI26_005558 [Coemansia sp. RSA 1358]KAJ2669765.1 hypothetical protein GGI25_006052 [Coemansia spiralis]
MLGTFSWADLPGEDDGRLSFRDSGLRSEVKKRIRSYLELIVISTVMIWSGLSLFFGAVHERSTKAENLDIYIFDLDGGEVSANVTQMIMDIKHSPSELTWRVNKDISSFDDARAWVLENGWGGLVINAGATENLKKALTENADYDSSKALTVLQSSGRQIVAEMLFVQSTLSTATSQVCVQYAINQLKSYQLSQDNITATDSQDKTNFAALINPLSYTTLDVAPENFPLAPVMMIFGFLCCLLCTIGVLILWKLTTFVFFVKVRFRDLVLMWYFLILCHSLIVSLYLSFAILAFRGPDYNSLALPYTGATFFKIWFTSAAVVLSLALWLFSWFMYLPPHLLALPSICTVIPNTVSAIAATELAPTFYRIMYAVPFFNGSRIIHYVITGAHPTFHRNIGVLIGEIVLMAICLAISIWIRQLCALRGISDAHGWFRGSLYFHSTIPYYKADPANSELHHGDDPEQANSPHHKQAPSGSTLSGNHTAPATATTAAIHGTRSSVIDISDDNENHVSLTTGNLGV